MAKHDVRFSVPLYTQAEAARHVDTPVNTLKYWTHPHERVGRSGQRLRSEPLVTYLPSRAGGLPSVPFIGLAEAVFLASLRRAGVSVREVRPALQLVRERIGVEYALASRRLYVLGPQLLWDAADEADLDPCVKRDLIVLRNGQYVFRSAVDHYLKKIEYSADDYATRLQLPGYEVANVIADPAMNFGRPFFASTGTPIGAVLSRLKAGEPVADVADDFDLDAEEVLEVADRQLITS